MDSKKQQIVYSQVHLPKLPINFDTVWPKYLVLFKSFEQNFVFSFLLSTTLSQFMYKFN